MSDSRLEKFIYAICSMDVSDLPVPLSRIEKLWNCLITGETPDFEPLSRNEKYLMAMLDRYDISNLPAPMSRGEKLLYKIAVGETDLSDVPGYLSRYEELLKYLIENGGISGGDFEYVLHTLNQSLNTLYLTAEKPVKNAILKGNTEINIKGTLYDDNEIKKDYNIPLVKNNTNYLIKYEIDYTPLDGITEPIFAIGFLSSSTTWWSSNLESQPSKNTVILNSGSEPGYFRIIGRREDISTINNVNLLIIEYQQGMENWDIPYFEGMQSVKLPVLTTTNCLNLFTKDNTVADGGLDVFGDFVEAKKNDKFSFNEKYGNTSWTSLAIYNVNKEGIYYKYEDSCSIPKTIVLPDDDRIAYVRPRVAKSEMDTIMFNRGEVIPYEEYKANKTNILTVNEPIELRGIGDVRDELNLLTGELVQKTEKIIFDGSEAWEVISSLEKDNTIFAQCYKYTRNNTNTISNILDYISSLDALDKRGFRFNHFFQIRLNKNEISDITNNGVKEWVSKNNIIVVRVKEQTVKTVDLSAVDQDGNDTKLSTFDDITHVTLSSEGLILEAELEVATKNEEDLEDSVVYAVHTLSEEFNTLYNTAEKPVKSAILKGQTLVNYFKPLDDVDIVGSLCGFQDGKIAFQFGDGSSIWGSSYTPGNLRLTNSLKVSPNTKYFAKLILSKPIDGVVQFGNFKESEYSTSDIITLKNNNTNIYQAIMTTRIDTDYIGVILYHSVAEIVYGELLVVPYQEGMENWDIPYFEGMQSIKMPVLTTTGKNLLNNQNNSKDTTIEKDGIVKTFVGRTLSDYVKVSKSKQYAFSGNGHSGDYVAFFDNSKTFIERISASTFTPKQDGYIRVFQYNSAEVLYQIEEGFVATEYEPYKSNILSTPSDLELRGIGEVQDTLDLMTGELTQRVSGLECIDQNSKLSQSETTNDTTLVVTTSIKSTSTSGKRGLVSSHELIKYAQLDNWFNNLSIIFKLPKANENFATLTAFKQFLTQNPFYYYRELEKEEISIKTVDLSVVDQNGNNTKLSTFNDITHVTLSSEVLIPEAELEVAEKVPEVAANMFTISREQEVINAATNEQSENVDATMIATTEIYEELL